MIKVGIRALLLKPNERRRGLLWSLAIVAQCLMAFSTASIAGPTILYSFTAPISRNSSAAINSDGIAPASRLVLGSDGALYGTTRQGGANGAGSIFRVSIGGTLSNLYSFPAATNSSGEIVYDVVPNDLIEGTDGNFYGTTKQGGSNFTGTIFVISSSGVLSTLHVFDAEVASSSGLVTSADGAAPVGALAQGGDGDFYGTTQYGGANGTGTIFQITPAGEFTSLYSFGKIVAGTATKNGTIPNALVLGNDGAFYGTTQQGGGDNAGTFFKFTPAGGFTQISAFNGGTPGGNPITPNGTLVQGTNGNFYGTSAFGGSQGGGAIFEITNTGGAKVLHSFPQLDAGAGATLTLGEDGNFYGTTAANGFNGNGTLFKLMPTGEFSFYAFGALNTNSDNAGGADPSGGLAADNNGNLYGTCAAGGISGSGLIFQIYGPNFIPPFFVSVSNPPPPLTNVLAGTPITFSYSVQGIAPLTCQWLLDGIAITNGGDFLGALSNTLVINQAFGRDAGSYSLVISNTWGALTSSVTQLTVTPPRISISSPAPNASIAVPEFAGTATNAPLFPNTDPGAVQLTLVVYTITNIFNGSNVSGTATLTSGAGGASNWSFTATPYPGTNLLSVRVVDTSGNTSLAATRSFFYDAPAPLTINTVGSGTGTFNITNGEMISLGKAYSITARPSASVFTSWVDNGIISYDPTLSFVMQSNLVLTAEFMARQRPTVSISFPTAGERSESTNFKGTAQSSPLLPGVHPDNVRLTNVTYWITNSASDAVITGSAVLTSGAGAVSNWSILASPSPGTNVLAVQSKDASGGLSPIVSKTFFYKVASEFTLLKGGSGNGTFTGTASIPGDIPPTNGAMLNIGERYTVMARPAPLSTFNSWVGSSGPDFTNPVLSFVMQPDLVLTAIFVESPPVVTISSPAENQRTAAPVFEGTAFGHFPITNVVCSLTGAKSFATLTQGAGAVSNWSITLEPSPGTNILTVYSVDVKGNQSAPVSRRFFYKVPSQLTVTNSGSGAGTFKGTASVPGDRIPANGAMLNIGEGYSITAISDKGSLFSNWVSVSDGSTPAASYAPTLQFVMQSNLVLTATFATNFFPAVAGAYNGLFYPASAVREETSGMLYNLVLRDTGAFTGQILTAATNYHFAANFNASGRAAFSVGELHVTLSLDIATPQITGIVSDSQFSANLIADLASNILQPASYTLLFSPTPNVSAVSPPGDGYALVTNKGDVVALSGALADGTKYSQAVPVSQNGDLPVYASLYSKSGSTNSGLLLGWINLTNLQGGAPTNALTWIKKPSHLSNLYTNGFTNILSVQGAVWANTPPISLTSGQLVISNTSLSLTFTSVAINSDGSLTNLGDEPTNSMSGFVDLKTGLLVVRFADDDGRANTNYGVILQSTTNGGGYFLTSTNSGSMILQQ